MGEMYIKLFRGIKTLENIITLRLKRGLSMSRKNILSINSLYFCQRGFGNVLTIDVPHVNVQEP